MRSDLDIMREHIDVIEKLDSMCLLEPEAIDKLNMTGELSDDEWEACHTYVWFYNRCIDTITVSKE